MDLVTVTLRVLAFAFGFWIVFNTVMSAVRTFVLPRGENTQLTRTVFRMVSRLFRFRARKATTYAERDRVMALYAPVTLLVLPVVWVILVVTGYTFMFWAVGVESWYQAFKISGSSLLTLGAFTIDTLPATLLEFSEATFGLGLVALLISYLPTMYASFSKREMLVSLLEVRAGSPPSAVTLLIRAHRIQGLDYLRSLWAEWEVWFTDIDESHTSLAALNFFRSPQPDRSWITAAGAILDTAALTYAVVAIPRNPESQLCIRAGYLALRHVCDFFRIPYPRDPTYPSHPISVTRAEFDEACAQLEEAGVPLVPDRDQAWQDFAGWRVNYDTVLLELAELLMAPYAPWVSDRGVPRSRRAR